MLLMKPFSRQDPDYQRAIERAIRARNHVRRIGVNHYEVRSRRRGQVYLVSLVTTLSDAIVPFCNCAAGQRGRVCHHSISAILLHAAFERGFTRRSERNAALPDDVLVKPIGRGEALEGWTI